MRGNELETNIQETRLCVALLAGGGRVQKLNSTHLGEKQSWENCVSILSFLV